LQGPHDLIEPERKRHGVDITRANAWLAAGLAALTLSVALYFAPRGFHAGFVDIGHDGYQLRQVLDLISGGVIFRDTFDQYGPLNGYLNAVGFVAFGRRLLAMKYFVCGWYALSAIALFMIARHWLDRWLAAFSVLVWLGLAPFYNHGIMISPHAYVLLFQAVATLVALRTPDLAPRRFALVGLLAGLSWAVKQAMGVLYVAAILCWLLIRPPLSRASWRGVIAAVAAASAAFFGVIAVCLGWLWMNGAIGDWYRQTIGFPRQFYLNSAAPFGIVDLIKTLFDQFTQSLYWVVIRAAVLLLPLMHRRGDRHQDAVMLMACITAFLWLGAYPSVNYMHQWWTASLAIPPFVVCLRDGIRRWAVSDRAVSFMAVAAVTIIVAPGLVERAKAGVARAHALTETLREPRVFRGIRTDAATKHAFEALYESIADFHADHPNAKVVSIETADGWGNGMVETLPLLSFLDDNTHIHPVYWNLPVLSTVVYGDYPERLWQYIRQDRPLIVDHRAGKYKPSRICAYGLLVSEKSDRGHWYVYAPDDRWSPRQPVTGEDSSDEWLDFPCSDDRTGPTRPRLPMTSADGSWRGVRASSPASDAPIRVTGSPPLELVDAGLSRIDRPVNVYTWPVELRNARVEGLIELVPTDVVWRAGKGDIVRDVGPGAWTIDGDTKFPLAYLLQWAETPVIAGSRFVVRGELFEGGLQIGFLKHDQWTASVSITRAGPFEAMIAIQNSGNYALVVANNIQSKRPDSSRQLWLAAVLRAFATPTFRNRATISVAGWIRP
jgi:hypothetical protein